MNNKRRIDLVKLDKLLRDGKSQRDAAKVFGVTEAAISLARKQLKRRIVRTVGLEKANEVVNNHLDMMSQLRKINNAINAELTRAQESVKGANGRDRLAVQEIIIKLSAEIRRQLESQLKIVEVWHDMKIVAEFQEEVLSVLDEMEPGARERVIGKLQERSALRGTIAFS